LTSVKTALDDAEADLQGDSDPPEKETDQIAFALERLTRKSLHVLRLLCDSGNRKTVLTSELTQPELARKLRVTRQALSIHVKRLTESGFIQVGRGFVNVTEKGLKAVGYHRNPVILIVRVTPQNQLEALEKIRKIPASQIFRVAGDADFALLIEQGNLDQVLGTLYAIEGVLETKTLIATEIIRQTTR